MKNSGWGDEDSAADDAANDDGAAIHQGHLRLQLDPLILLVPSLLVHGEHLHLGGVRFLHVVLSCCHDAVVRGPGQTVLV